MFMWSLSQKATKKSLLFSVKRAFHGPALIDPSIGLDDSQKVLYAMVRSFSNESFAPKMQTWDEHEIFPLEVLQRAASLGFGGIYVTDEKKGGSNMSRLEASIIFEALSTGCTSTAAFLSIHNMCAWMLDSFASESLKQKYLRKMTSFQLVASYCLTEPGSGSDAASLQTTAIKKGSEYILNGSKAFISGGGESDVYIIMARTGEEGANGISAFIVEKKFPGINFGKKEKKLGWNSQPTRAVLLEDCRVPEENLLGILGSGFKIAMKGLDGGRVNISSCSLGAAQASLEQTIEYLKIRAQFQRPLINNQGLQFKLAEMAENISASRLFVRQAARMIDSKDLSASAYCAMSKSFVTGKCFSVIDEALQLHGGYGYLKDYRIQQYWRDARVHRILEGTNEIMKVLVSRALQE